MLEVDHLAFNCRDVDTMLAFYTELLNAKSENQQRWHRGECEFPSVRLSDHCILDLFPPSLWQSDTCDAGGPAGINHVCLAMTQSEWQQACERLRQMGGTLERGPEPLSGARGQGIAVYLRDPENNRVELRYYPT